MVTGEDIGPVLDAMRYKADDVVYMPNGMTALVLYVNDRLRSYHVKVLNLIDGWGYFHTDVREDEVK